MVRRSHDTSAYKTYVPSVMFAYLAMRCRVYKSVSQSSTRWFKSACDGSGDPELSKNLRRALSVHCDSCSRVPRTQLVDSASLWNTVVGACQQSVIRFMCGLRTGNVRLSASSCHKWLLYTLCTNPQWIPRTTGVTINLAPTKIGPGYQFW